MSFSIGQIRLNELEGDLIYKTVVNYKPVSIVEIGTWNGLGSTKCVIQAIKDSNLTTTKFVSLELYPEMYNEAICNLTDEAKYVELLNGRIIDYDETFWFDHSTIDFSKDLHAKLFFEKDLEYLKTQKNVLSSLPEYIDLLILDGGEYSSYPEWIKLKNRTNIVILDDTAILKCSRIREEILFENKHEILYDNLNARNGFSIFKRK